jgi:hypothetical protein
MVDSYDPHRDIRRQLRREYRAARRLAKEKRQWAERRDGSQGAASACRIIDPQSGEVVAEIEAGAAGRI